MQRKRPFVICKRCGKEISTSNINKHLKRHEDNPGSFKNTIYRLTHEGLSCQFCEKECKNRNSLCNHERLCKKNPNRQPGGFELHRKTKLQQGIESHPWNYRLTQYSDSRVKAQADKVKKEKPEWQKIVDDDDKLYRRYLNKINNAKREGLICELTFFEYCSLVVKSGLKSSDLGFSGKGYVLARYHDEGNYSYGNCRFILQSENSKEKWERIKNK